MFHHRDNHKFTDFLFLKHDWNPEVIEYYFYKVFRNIAFALISLFIPIFLYAEVWYSVFQIMLFFLINEFLFLSAIPFSWKIIEKIWIKHSILIHLPGMIIFSYWMRYLTWDFNADILLIVFLLFCRVVPKSTMWSAEQIFISKNILKKKGSEWSSLARIKIILIIATLISPLIWWIVTYVWWFEMFFNIAIWFMVLAMIPLLLTKDQYFHTDKSPTDIVRYVFKTVPKNFHIAEWSRWCIDSLLWIVWPLFLYIVVQNTLNLGLLTSISALISIVVSYYVWKKIDISWSKKLLTNMTKVYAMIFFIRSIFPNQILIIFFDTINKILDPVMMLPYEKYYYKFIKSNKNILEITIASLFIMELYYFISLLFLVIYFGILEIYNVNITYLSFIFLFVSYGSLTLLMTKISKVKKSKKALFT